MSAAAWSRAHFQLNVVDEPSGDGNADDLGAFDTAGLQERFGPLRWPEIGLGFTIVNRRWCPTAKSMAHSDHLISLVRAGVAGDRERLRSAAEAIAADRIQRAPVLPADKVFLPSGRGRGAVGLRRTG